MADLTYDDSPKKVLVLQSKVFSKADFGKVTQKVLVLVEHVEWIPRGVCLDGIVAGRLKRGGGSNCRFGDHGTQMGLSYLVLLSLILILFQQIY